MTLTHRTAAMFVGTALLIAGCGISADQRRAEVAAARAVVGAPATALGTAASAVSMVFEEILAGGHDDVEGSLEALSGLESGELDDLNSAAKDAASVKIDGEGPDAEAARLAWDHAHSSAKSIVAAAPILLDFLRAVLEAEAEVAALAAEWQEPGSRREQMDRFQNSIRRADEIGRELAAVETPSSCVAFVERRVAAAMFVSETTKELRQLVAAHRGLEFDARRTELLDDPFGLGSSMAAADSAETACWDDSGVAMAGRDLETALDDLEMALNPADL